MKYYVGNTLYILHDNRFRYTKIEKTKIACHVLEAGYLVDQADIKRKNKRKNRGITMFTI